MVAAGHLDEAERRAAVADYTAWMQTTDAALTAARGLRDRPPGPRGEEPPVSAAMDPVTFDICWNRLVGVVNEQAAALQRTSFTSIVREAGDLSAGVFDRRGWMLAQAVTGTPGHINSMALCLRHMLAAIPVEALRPGDVLITNDPWKGSGHLNDVTIATPVFRGHATAWRSSPPPATPPTSAATSCRRRRARCTRRGSSSPS